MSLATHVRSVLGIAAFVAIMSILVAPRGAEAYVDQNLNRIDDRIEQVNANGWNAAFESSDPTKRMVIAVSPLTQREEVPVIPSTSRLVDSVGLPRIALTSCSVMPFWTFAKFSCVTLEQAARTSTRDRAKA